MKHTKSIMRKSRDLGIPSCGKGDGSRITNVAEFNKNFEAIMFTYPPEGFKKIGHKQIKTYGKN